MKEASKSAGLLAPLISWCRSGLTLSIAVMLCSTLSCGQDVAERSLFLVSMEGRRGYINLHGEIAIRPQFRMANRYSEGYALVEDDDGERYFIDRQGQPAFKVQIELPPYPWSWIGDVHDGRVLVKVYDGKHLFVDTSGKQVSARTYEDARPFSCGRAAVKIDGTWGFIDTGCQLIIQTEYEEAMPFEDDGAIVRSGDRWGVIGVDGEYLIEPIYRNVLWYAGGIAAVHDGEKVLILDSGGNVLDLPVVYPFANGLAPARNTANAWGYVNRSGRWVIPPHFDHCEEFAEGLGAVDVNGRWGFVDLKGEMAIEARFQRVESFWNGLAEIWIDGTDGTGYVNKDGQIVWQPSR